MRGVARAAAGPSPLANTAVPRSICFARAPKTASANRLMAASARSGYAGTVTAVSSTRLGRRFTLDAGNRLIGHLNAVCPARDHHSCAPTSVLPGILGAACSRRIRPNGHYPALSRTSRPNALRQRGRVRGPSRIWIRASCGGTPHTSPAEKLRQRTPAPDGERDQVWHQQSIKADSRGGASAR